MNFFSKWKKGIKELTNTQLLHSKLIGIGGNIFGMIFAAILLVYYGMWYFIIVMAFTTFLQVIEFISVRKQYLEAVRVESELKKYMEGNQNGFIGN